MTPRHSPLGRRAGRTATTEAELEAMRAAVWHKQGIAMVCPDEVQDEWLAQAVRNWAGERWGRRG